ncbi:FAD/NAD(P)-binding protein [Pseudochrobactrum sp. MP213Fo]|uniref:FAD/NAD(P)-binding protein n=1 Tax=Pseudochrobactrum sp. MP213Fo TaxID=3022250 RepID=UPI003BA1E3F4
MHTASTDQPTAQIKAAKSVIIIGGGFSGATLALHLAAISKPEQISITIIEPRAALGAGLAYSTDEDAFRLNVLCDRMSIFYDDKPHFARWVSDNNRLGDDPLATTDNGQVYARRTLFGSYMAAQIQPMLESGRIRHKQARAISAERLSGAGYRVVTETGETTEADYLVIAASHPLPALPAPLKSLGKTDIDAIKGLLANPYQPGAIEQLIVEKGRDCSVLIIGAGLTSADMVAGLSQHGHSGKITVLSRHGLRSRPNLHLKPDAPKPPRLYGDFINPPEQSATKLLRRIRNTIREAALHAVPWQSVIDALRDQGTDIWLALPLAERQRIVRHLRTYWDAHRFRLATQTDLALEERCRNRTLNYLAAHVTEAHYAADENGFNIAYRMRGQTEIITQHFDAIIITTGPAHSDIIGQCPPLAMLHAAGLIDMDPTGLGLHTSTTMRAVSKSREVIDDLFIAGPLARGTFGELMGAPEVTRYTQALAEVIELASDTDKAPV